MKTVETVKPSRGIFAGGCRFEAFSFGSIRIDGVTLSWPRFHGQVN